MFILRSSRSTDESCKSTESYMSRLALSLLAVLSIVIGGLALRWFSISQLAEARQRAWDSAQTARTAGLKAIEDADILAYERNLYLIDDLKGFSGQAIDGHDLAQTSETFRNEMSRLAIEALPRFVAELERSGNQYMFGAVLRLSWYLDEEGKKRWLRESLPLYDRFSPETALDHWRSVRYDDRKKRREHCAEVLAQADRSQSYTITIKPENKMMADNNEQFSELHESVFEELNARLAPIPVMLRSDNEPSGGKGHIFAGISAVYSLHTSAASKEWASGATDIPDGFTVKIVVTPRDGGFILRTVRVKQDNSRKPRFLNLADEYWRQYYRLEEQLERELRTVNLQ
jgi:hypothetical protein